MEKTRIYELDKTTVRIPLIYDEKLDMYIEDYREFIESPKYTEKGHPILFAAEDACELAIEKTPGGCPDCGSCLYYIRAAQHSLIGICNHTLKKELPI